MEAINKSIFPLKMGILSIVLYASAHLLEEGLFDFPAWVEKFRFTIPMILLFKHLSRYAELNKKHVFKGIGTAILLWILPMLHFWHLIRLYSKYNNRLVLILK